ncbi:sulfatase-like hydrolase/transferase [Acidisoma sp. 7E03]
MADQAPEAKKASRRSFLTGAGALGTAAFLPDPLLAAPAPQPEGAPPAPPAGYNILFILVDQEHFFPKWPMPVPAREWIKSRAVTFTNHQSASCVCSPARSTIYTGHHIQQTGVFDNAGFLWQPDMSTSVKTVGHRLSELGYHAAYQGKWHLSGNLDQAKQAVDAPLADYRSIIESYGFQDFLGLGDIIDTTLGGYQYDETTTAFTARWLRTHGEALSAAGKPWFLAVNFVNPHDVMYVNSDVPGQVVQGKASVLPIAPPPLDEIYRAEWEVDLPATRAQAFDAPGRPRAQQIYQQVQDVLVGVWPDEDRRWRLLRNYYLNCIRDCDRQVARVLTALQENGLDRKTIIVFTADHGELGGNHQMRGKGNCTYWQQNHVPLMILHPAYPGGMDCRPVTSQIDLVPTLLALTGAAPEAVARVGAGLPGRSIAPLLTAPAQAEATALRPAALFNYDMLTYQDAAWAALTERFARSDAPLAERQAFLEKNEPDWSNRCAIRSVFDGRYRFSRYFAPNDFNTPTTYKDLTAHNDLELYDLQEDPEEVRNLAAEPGGARDLVMAMNAVLNGLIAAEVGVDDGAFLPLRNGKMVFPKAG